MESDGRVEMDLVKLLETDSIYGNVFGILRNLVGELWGTRVDDDVQLELEFVKAGYVLRGMYISRRFKTGRELS